MATLLLRSCPTSASEESVTMPSALGIRTNDDVGVECVGRQNQIEKRSGSVFGHSAAETADQPETEQQDSDRSQGEHAERTV